MDPTYKYCSTFNQLTHPFISIRACVFGGGGLGVWSCCSVAVICNITPSVLPSKPPTTHGLSFSHRLEDEREKRARVTLPHTSCSPGVRGGSVSVCTCVCVCAFNHACNLNLLRGANQYRPDEYWQTLIKDSLPKPSVSSSPQNGDCEEENTSFCVQSGYLCVCVLD